MLALRPALLALCAAWSCVACGASLPARGVLESDLGEYRFRRYQQVLDVEFSVADNPAVGHTATYIRPGGALSISPAFVTVFERSAGLAPSVRKELRAMQTYQYGVQKVHGEHVWTLDGEGGDRWLLWPSGARIIKLGVPEDGDEVPEDVRKAYLKAYPSDLDERGRTEQESSP